MGKHALVCFWILQNRRGMITLREFPLERAGSLRELLHALPRGREGMHGLR